MKSEFYIKHYGKSFFWAGKFLKKEIFTDCAILYAFCRVVDDLVDGIVRMLGSSSDITGPVNLGNPTEFTLLELVQTLEHVMGKKLPISYKPLPEDDPKQRCPDISKAKTLLGWNPQTQLQDGLVKTIAYFQTALKNPTQSTTIQKLSQLL